MITNLLPYIYGIGYLLIGIFILLVSFKIYKLKFKDEESKIKIENILNKYSILIKLLSIFLILNGSYDLIIRDTNRYKIVNENENNKWTEKQRENMINECIENAKTKGTYYNGLTDEYCGCSVDKMMKALPLDKYMEMQNNTSKQKRSEIIKPIVKDCLDEYQKKIDSIEKIKKTAINK